MVPSGQDAARLLSPTARTVETDVSPQGAACAAGLPGPGSEVKPGLVLQAQVQKPQVPPAVTTEN